jgi:hypothetical protein
MFEMTPDAHGERPDVAYALLNFINVISVEIEHIKPP